MIAVARRGAMKNRKCKIDIRKRKKPTAPSRGLLVDAMRRRSRYFFLPLIAWIAIW